MDSKGVVSLPLIHNHQMMPWNDLRKGDCCGHFEAISDGYYCKRCDFFVHKTCGDGVSEYIEHPSHPNHTLELCSNLRFHCDLCGRRTNYLSYYCEICGFIVDLHCAMYPPPEFIENSERHHHKLTLLKERIAAFDCDAKCGKISGSTIDLSELSKVVLNNSISRPFCSGCKMHCIFPIILKIVGTSDKYFCSIECAFG
ncbi:unnamed protein product [Arabidopsis thaliana]|uniref:(thale cress) hypothetical protein n=1 Tax=Arabidopsis thaliana TaxID=3702 RepID=A0A7G2EU87_ARATH|nr:unnamed protein product [Arabidopsis thaliana]